MFSYEVRVKRISRLCFVKVWELGMVGIRSAGRLAIIRNRYLTTRKKTPTRF